MRDNPKLTPRAKDQVLGCMVGGVVGDALGYAVEFSSYGAIVKQKRLLLQLFHTRLQTFCSIGCGDRLSAVVQVDKDVFVMAHAQLFHVG